MAFSLRGMLSSLLTFVGIGVAFYLIACLFLFLQQDRILFYPRPNDAALAERWRANQVQIVSGEHTLVGWWAENPNSTTSRVIIYFGGNAEDVLYTLSQASAFDARRMLAVNYRGYGASPGKPSQQALYEDALAIYDFVVASGAAQPQDIVPMGRSLGSAMAVLLAARRPVAATILITPFDSIAAVAASHYPIFPVKLLLKHPFDSAALARHTTVPALILAAERDGVIPPAHARALFDAWAGPKQFQLLHGVGHNDVERNEHYFELINAFLRSH